MKALPLWQPWASLVAVGAKRVETRHWRAPQYLVGQRIAIHATKTKDHLYIVASRPFCRLLREARDAGSLVFVDGELPLGAIVGSAVIDRCAAMTAASCDELRERDRDEFDLGHYEPGRFAWVLRDAVPLAEPIPWRGSQGIFEVPDELLGFTPAQGTLA